MRERYTVEQLRSNGKYVIVDHTPGTKHTYPVVNGVNQWTHYHEACDAAADLGDKYGYTF
jgi:hypothetical protein